MWVELQAWGCVKVLDLPGDIFDIWTCSWIPQSRSATRLVFAGGGSANRVNAREACAFSSQVSWRAVVDVDIPNQNDSADKFAGAAYTLNCYPGN